VRNTAMQPIYRETYQTYAEALIAAKEYMRQNLAVRITEVASTVFWLNIYKV